MFPKESESFAEFIGKSLERRYSRKELIDATKAGALLGFLVGVIVTVIIAYII